jgi:hypothetical protein
VLGFALLRVVKLKRYRFGAGQIHQILTERGKRERGKRGEDNEKETEKKTKDEQKTKQTREERKTHQFGDPHMVIRLLPVVIPAVGVQGLAGEVVVVVVVVVVVFLLTRSTFNNLTENRNKR